MSRVPPGDGVRYLDPVRDELTRLRAANALLSDTLARRSAALDRVVADALTGLVEAGVLMRQSSHGQLIDGPLGGTIVQIGHGVALERFVTEWRADK